MSKIETIGRHEVLVKTASFGESKTGTPFIEFNFENDKGESILGWLYLSPAAFDNSVKTLRDAFGFDNNFETLPAQVTNKRCAITTEEEEYEGKPRLKVKWINALRSVVPLKDPSALSKFSALAARIPVEQRAKAANTTPKAAPAPKAATTAPAASSDEFPTEGKNPY